MIRTVPREHLRNVQTPQIFRRDLLEKAYKQAVRSERQFTDDAAVAEAFTELKIRLVNDPYPNPKLTYPEDLSLIEKLS